MKNKILIIVTVILGIVFFAMLYLTTKMGTTNSQKEKWSLNNKNENIKQEERIDYKSELNVYNAAEYMDMDTVKDFEKKYKVKVNYKEFESNESMYSDFVNNSNSYDVLIPSDYMIDRLIQENRLEKLDKSKIKNISNIASEYLNPEYDPDNEYVVPYMIGTLGILYNKKLVK